MTDSASPRSTPIHVSRWRIATIACVILLLLAAATGMSMFEQFTAQIAHLQHKLKTTPQIRYVAVLLDQSHAPALLATFDPQDGVVQLQRLNDVKEGPNDSLQLWALDEAGQPLSLGVITPGIRTAQLRASDDILSQARALAISVEDKGGAEADHGPRLPYLFQGALIRKAQ